MGDILRRREIMAQAGGSSGPLYTFDNLFANNSDVSSSNVGYSTITISNGNHFKYWSRNRGSGYIKYANFAVACSKFSSLSSEPVMFNFFAGDQIELKLKDGYVNCGQRASYNGYARFSLRDASNTLILGWNGSGADYELYTTGKVKKEFSELSVTKTLEADVSAMCFYWYAYGNTQACQITLEADIELYVNGVRYI